MPSRSTISCLGRRGQGHDPAPPVDRRCQPVLDGRSPPSARPRRGSTILHISACTWWRNTPTGKRAHRGDSRRACRSRSPPGRRRTPPDRGRRPPSSGGRPDTGPPAGPRGSRPAGPPGTGIGHRRGGHGEVQPGRRPRPRGSGGRGARPLPPPDRRSRGPGDHVDPSEGRPTAAISSRERSAKSAGQRRLVERVPAAHGGGVRVGPPRRVPPRAPARRPRTARWTRRRRRRPGRGGRRGAAWSPGHRPPAAHTEVSSPVTRLIRWSLPCTRRPRAACHRLPGWSVYPPARFVHRIRHTGSERRNRRARLPPGAARCLRRRSP